MGHWVAVYYMDGGSLVINGISRIGSGKEPRVACVLRVRSLIGGSSVRVCAGVDLGIAEEVQRAHVCVEGAAGFLSYDPQKL